MPALKVVNQILKINQRADTIFAANDACALYCMRTLKQAVMQIPRDIVFAGFTNDPMSKVVEPNLTGVNYAGYTMGKAPATQLVNHLTGVSSLKATNIIILRRNS